MTRFIGEDGPFVGQPQEDDLEKDRLSNKAALGLTVAGIAIMAAAGCFIVQHEDEETARTLAEQQAKYSGTSTRQHSTTPSETETPHSTIASSFSPTAVPTTPFSPSTRTTTKPSTRTSTSRPASPVTKSTTKTQTSSTPKPCRIAPVSYGVAAVTNACGGDMLGYSTDSAPFPLSPGTQVEFDCQSRDKNGRVKVTVSNGSLYMMPSSIGNPC